MGTILGLAFYGLSVVPLAIFMFWAITCLGIIMTFHRCMAHKSFKFRFKWMEYVGAFLGAIGGTGSGITWAAIHREHHAFTDSDKDPHRVYTTKGWGSLFIIEYPDLNVYYAKHLVQDKGHRFIFEYYSLIITVWFLLLTIIGGPWLLVAMGLMPMFLSKASSVLNNWLDHSSGYRNFDTKDESTNCWWTAPFTWGDNWHNNHHRNPIRYTTQVKWWEFDLAGRLIKILGKDLKL